MVQRLQNLLILDCIPNCKECPGKWKNEHIKHYIVCECKKCDHGASVRDYHKEFCTSSLQKFDDTSMTMTGTGEKGT